jgi:PAS domain S-box-containing protein
VLNSTVLLYALPETTTAWAVQALSEMPQAFITAHEAADALRLMGAECPAIVVVGGGSTQEVAESCRQFRAADRDRDAVIVAVATQGSEDVRTLLDAGADDFFVESLGETVLRGRLHVAQRAAAGIATRRAAEQDRAHFFELSLQLFCIAGADGCLKTVNPAWTRVLGWSPEELLSRPWLDFVHPDDREATVGANRSVAAGGRVTGFVNRHRCKFGGYRWLEWRATPSVERGVVFAVAIDITSARGTQEALQELSESLATTLDSIADGVIATDLGGRVVRMNPVAEQLTGRSLAEARGIPLMDVLPLVQGDTREKLASPVDRAMREGIIVGLAKRTVLTRRDGTEIPIADSCAPIRSADGVVIGAVLVFRDLTTQQSAEAVQARFQKQLVFADRMAAVGTLAAGVAHEINNPLSYVVANVDLAIEEILSMRGGEGWGRMKGLEEMLLEAREGIARVTRIVRALKTFSRVEEERPSIVDLIPVIELSVNMANNEIRHRARLVMDYGEIPLVEADEARLGQVFINLLVNAAHAFPDGNGDTNVIRIVTSTDAAGRAVVEVHDTGVGMPPDILGRVFDPFFTTKPVGIGTGLGLSISHNIVTAMGGEISVRSDLGCGTTFRVVLPASIATETSARVTSPPPKASSSRSGIVLVVDDEPILGQTMRRVLAQHEVHVVTSGEEALKLLATGIAFDVVLSDLMMPGMSGMEFYRELEKSHPGMTSKVVFVTGGAFTPEAHAFLDGVANRRMEKPFDALKLREVVQKFLH